jgi:hypothetical protein
MKSKQIYDNPKTFVLIFETGDEVVAGLQRFADEQRLNAATLQAIGAFEKCTVGYFDWQKKDYQKIPINEQVEVLSLLGNFSLKGEKRQVHAHLVVGTSQGVARGGHLLEAIVRPTLEVVVTESPAHLRRRWNEQAHLALIEV